MLVLVLLQATAMGEDLSGSELLLFVIFDSLDWEEVCFGEFFGGSAGWFARTFVLEGYASFSFSVEIFRWVFVALR